MKMVVNIMKFIACIRKFYCEITKVNMINGGLSQHYDILI